MKTIRIVLFLTYLLSNSFGSNAQSKEFYQIKTYLLKSDKQTDNIDNYLKNAFLPAIKRTGIKDVGVFKPKSTTDSITKIIVILPFTSVQQFLELEKKLENDKNYQISGNDYINAPFNDAPYARIETILLQSFSDHPFLTKPELKGPRKDRVYELRSYESATEKIYKSKVDMFNAGGEVKLFDRLEFNPVFYGEVVIGDKMPNLMYLTTFSNQESRDLHWKSFVESPEWKELLTLDKYKNTISHMEIQFLYPTEYSDY